MQEDTQQEHQQPIGVSIKILTPEESQFCQLYVSHSNATQAYLNSFVKNNGLPVAYDTARTQGCQLLRKKHIRDRIDSLVDEVNIKHNKGKMATIVQVSELAMECRKLKKYAECYKFLDMICKLQGMYEPTKVELQGNIEFEFVVPTLAQVINVGAHNTDTNDTEDSEVQD